MREIKAILIALIPLVISLLDGLSPQSPDVVMDVSPDLADSLAKGKKLAQTYCTSCHLFTEAALLDKNTWVKSVLPNMALRLGIRNPSDPAPPNDSIYPAKALLAKKDWNLIVKYFEHEAPAQLPMPEIKGESTLFSFFPQPLTLSEHQFPQTTMIKYDQTTSHFFIGDAHQQLYFTNGRFQLINRSTTSSPAVDMDFPKGKSPRLLCIGSIAPSDQKRGELQTLDGNPNSLKLQQLARPVGLTRGDLNGDGQDDLVLCSFGNNQGRLSWYENADANKEHLLSTLPGARIAEIRDFDGDQRKDLIVMRAQAQEAVSIYYNRGAGRFEEKVVLQFPPVYGLSHLETADFNGDGHLDLLLSNGDNWDYSAILKPYHGVRVFLNDGKNQFKQTYFYPLYGTSKAVARDFDQDGDLDIAAIAFYANLEQPEYGFVYLQNEGNLTFTSQISPEAANGKWLCMETGDFDRDGDEDIVLGAYFHTAAEVAQLAMHGVGSFPQLLVFSNVKK